MTLTVETMTPSQRGYWLDIDNSDAEYSNTENFLPDHQDTDFNIVAGPLDPSKLDVLLDPNTMAPAVQQDALLSPGLPDPTVEPIVQQ
jgi:cephalosporin-C deacetylase-like acetyl esterase